MSYIIGNTDNLSDCNCGLSGTREKYICEAENEKTHRGNINALWRLNGSGQLNEDELNGLLDAENLRYNNRKIACNKLKIISGGGADMYQNNSKGQIVRNNLMDSPLEERFYNE